MSGIVLGILYLIDWNQKSKQRIKLAARQRVQFETMKKNVLAEIEKRFGRAKILENTSYSLSFSCQIPFVATQGNEPVNIPVRELHLNLNHNPDRHMSTIVVLKLFQLASGLMVNAGERTLQFDYVADLTPSKIPNEISERIDVMRMNCNSLQGFCEDWE